MIGGRSDCIGLDEMGEMRWVHVCMHEMYTVYVHSISAHDKTAWSV